MKKRIRRKNVEKLQADDWMMQLIFLILAYQGIYVQNARSYPVESRGLEWPHKVIEILRLCLVMRTLIEQLLS